MQHSLQYTIWNYNTENHTIFFLFLFLHTEKNNTEITLKNIYKGNHFDNHTEMFFFAVQGHWNHTEKILITLKNFQRYFNISFVLRNFSVTLYFQCHNV